MTDKEFNKYCAEVMGYEYHDSPLSDPINIGYTKNGVWYVQDLYRPRSDLNQIAEVFDKLWMENYRPYTFAEWISEKGIATAMREFIESTHEK